MIFIECYCWNIPLQLANSDIFYCVFTFCIRLSIKLLLLLLSGFSRGIWGGEIGFQHSTEGGIVGVAFELHGTAVGFPFGPPNHG